MQTGSLYCLFSTRDGLPRYIGITMRYYDERHHQHRRDAENCSALPVHKWMRDEWLSGYGVENLLIGNYVKNDIEKYESQYIKSLPDLLNIKKKRIRRSTNSRLEQTRLHRKCDKQIKHFVDNHKGFHGIRYFKNEDAFQVFVTTGNRRCCKRRNIKGDILPGSDQGSYIWFSSLNRALNARDKYRVSYSHMMSIPISFTGENISWPDDDIDFA